MLEVNEIFGPTIQGEGLRIGERAWFIRLSRCDLRCPWCDTKYAWLPGEMMPEEDIADRLDPRECDGVVITGGNPALQDATDLVKLLRFRGHVGISVETQGTVYADWLRLVDTIAVSPKRGHVNEDVIHRICNLPREVFLKPVVFDDEDFEFAMDLAGEFPDITTVFQVGSDGDAGADLERLRWLMERVSSLHTTLDIRVLPQLHVIAWGQRRGV